MSTEFNMLRVWRVSGASKVYCNGRRISERRAGQIDTVARMYGESDSYVGSTRKDGTHYARRVVRVPDAFAYLGEPEAWEGRMPVRDDVTEVEYRRPPTPGEIRFGHGATHYRTFPLDQCCLPGSRILKRWFIAADDGLRYYY
jgi:hypothetical protein